MKKLLLALFVGASLSVSAQTSQPSSQPTSKPVVVPAGTTLQNTSPEMKRAYSMARSFAKRNLASMVKGGFFTYNSRVELNSRSVKIAYSSKFNMGKNSFQIVSEWPLYSMVKVRTSIERKSLLRSLKKYLKGLVAEGKMKQEDLPGAMKALKETFWRKTYSTYGYGFGGKGRSHPGIIYLRTKKQNEIEALKELIAFFKGPTVQASSRLENFLLTEDKIVASIAFSLAGAEFSYTDPNFTNPKDCPVKATIHRDFYITSLMIGLDKKEAGKLTAEELAKLEEILPKTHTVTVGGVEDELEFK